MISYEEKFGPNTEGKWDSRERGEQIYFPIHYILIKRRFLELISLNHFHNILSHFAYQHFLWLRLPMVKIHIRCFRHREANFEVIKLLVSPPVLGNKEGINVVKLGHQRTPGGVS